MIKFDENQSKQARISQTLVKLEVTSDIWIQMIQIFPSVNSMSYSYAHDPTESAVDINGGICGLTQIVTELSGEFWIKVDNSYAKSVTFPSCSGYNYCATQEYADAWR